MTTTEDIAVLQRIAASLSADRADGGVTAAAIENEVVSPERARSLVQARDEAARFAALWKRTAREQVRRTRLIAGRTRVQADYIGRLRREVEKARQDGDVDPLPIVDEVARQDGVIHELRKQLEDVERAATTSPRPVTADDLGPEHLTVRRAAEAYARAVDDGNPFPMTLAVRAALTPPPSRPEGAEELETVIGCNAGKWTNGAEDVRALADLLASNGVRVTGGK